MATLCRALHFSGQPCPPGRTDGYNLRNWPKSGASSHTGMGPTSPEGVSEHIDWLAVLLPLGTNTANFAGMVLRFCCDSRDSSWISVVPTGEKGEVCGPKDELVRVLRGLEGA